MYLYSYEGPVVMFGRVISQKWSGQTRAINKSRARSNLMYQYKKSHNMIPGSKIDFRADILKVNE